MNTTRGLTLGKFAPLHKGHQLLIETALAEVDELIVLVYNCPETTDVPLSVRANWVRRLYPAARVIEVWDGPTEVGDSPAIKQAHEQYIARLLGAEIITHFYSSEFYGEHMSAALGAQDRRVDGSRVTAPVSGTLIRADPYRWRAFLDPIVYRDLISNVVFLGAPSTGKSTLAAHLAQLYHTRWMPEYGREYWEAHQVARRLTPEQLVAIAEGHLARENELLAAANRYLFSDTNAITTYMFALAYHGFALPRLAELAALAASRYDVVFLCANDIPYDDTWDRSGETDRQVFQQQIRADLLLRKIPFLTLHGSLEERAALVSRVLARHTKYSSLADSLREMRQ